MVQWFFSFLHFKIVGSEIIVPTTMPTLVTYCISVISRLQLMSNQNKKCTLECYNCTHTNNLERISIRIWRNPEIKIIQVSLILKLFSTNWSRMEQTNMFIPMKDLMTCRHISNQASWDNQSPFLLQTRDWTWAHGRVFILANSGTMAVAEGFLSQ